MKIGLIVICLLFAPITKANVVCETCSRQGCSSPIYHCPLGTHCVRNCTIPVGTEETELMRIKKGKQFNVELPIAGKHERWILNPMPSKNVIELLYQGPAINDPELFIFNFRAKKRGAINLVFKKVEAKQPGKQGEKIEQPRRNEKAEKILEEKHIMLKVIPVDAE